MSATFEAPEALRAGRRGRAPCRPSRRRPGAGRCAARTRRCRPAGSCPASAGAAPTGSSGRPSGPFRAGRAPRGDSGSGRPAGCPRRPTRRPRTTGRGRRTGRSAARAPAGARRRAANRRRSRSPGPAGAKWSSGTLSVPHPKPGCGTGHAAQPRERSAGAASAPRPPRRAPPPARRARVAAGRGMRPTTVHRPAVRRSQAIGAGLGPHASLPGGQRFSRRYPDRMATDGTILGGRARDEERSVLAREWRELGRAATFVAVLTQPGRSSPSSSAQRLAAGLGAAGHVPRVIAFRGADRRPRPPAHPARRASTAPTARRCSTTPSPRRRALVLARQVPPAALARRLDRRRLGVIAIIAGQSIGDSVARRRRLHRPATLAADPHPRDPAADAVPGQLPDPLRAAALLRPQADEGLRAGRRRLGRAARGRPRPGGAQGGGHPRHRRSGSRARSSARRAASPSAACCSSARRAPARRCSPRRIATSFNSPIVTMPGSGFAQTFIGMDVDHRDVPDPQGAQARAQVGRAVHHLHRRDRRRRPAPPGARRRRRRRRGFEPTPPPSRSSPFYGPWGALNPSGDLILETRAWRERLFARARRRPRAGLPPGARRASADRINGFIVPGGMGGMGGGMALNQLLIQMDGVDEPPFWRKFWTNRINTFLDATYIVPRKARPAALRMPRRPSRAPEQIYFIGATNVPIDRARPGAHPPGPHGPPHLVPHADQGRPQGHLRPLPRQGRPRPRPRHATKRRDELARITNGYSPAMIEQVCSMALTYAHSDGRAGVRAGTTSSRR